MARAQSPRRARRPAGCRPRSPARRRRAPRPTHRDTCCGTGARPASRVFEQPRAAAGSLAAAVLGKRDLGLQPIHAGSTELVERSGLRCGHQSERRVERAGPEARLGRGQRALGPPRGFLSQCDGALQECSRGGESTAGFRSPGRPLELSGHDIVGTEHGLRAVPGTAVRVDLWIGRRGQCSVRVAALSRGRSPVDRRPQKWVAEAHACADLDQFLRLGRRTLPQPGFPARRRPATGGWDHRRDRPPPPAAGCCVSLGSTSIRRR